MELTGFIETRSGESNSVIYSIRCWPKEMRREVVLFRRVVGDELTIYRGAHEDLANLVRPPHSISSLTRRRYAMTTIRETVISILARRPDSDSRWVYSATAARHPEIREMPLHSFVVRYLNPLRRKMKSNGLEALLTEQQQLESVPASTRRRSRRRKTRARSRTTSTRRKRSTARRRDPLDAFRAVVRRELTKFANNLQAATTPVETIDVLLSIERHIDKIAAAWEPVRRTRRKATPAAAMEEASPATEEQVLSEPEQSSETQEQI